MSLKGFAVVAISVVLTLNAGCANSPAAWSKELVFQLRCDMTVNDVQQAIGRKIMDETRGGAIKDPRGTHAVESDDLRTVVWFTFLENKLQGFRIGWSDALIGYGGMNRTSYIDLCSSEAK